MANSTGIGTFTMPRVQITSGEVFEDGTVIEVVTRGDQDELLLLRSDRTGDPYVAPAVIRGSVLYQNQATRGFERSP